MVRIIALATSSLTVPRAAFSRRVGGLATAAGLALALAAPASASVPASVDPARPGPQVPDNAQAVITALKRRGDQVIINRNGPTKPLSQCIATSVRVGRHIYNQVPQRKGPPTRSLASHVMYVTVQC